MTQRTRFWQLRERLPQLKAEVDDVASARLPGLQRQLLTIGDSINAMWEVINGLVNAEAGAGAAEERGGEAQLRAAEMGAYPEVSFP